jgi:hypothetical protein
MICMHLKILAILIGLNLTVVTGQVSAKRNYYNLRWVTKDPVLPIFIEKTTNAVDSADFKWFKYPQEVYLDEEENYDSKYLFSQSLNTTVLYILEYNLRTHEQLGTYEPVAMGLRTNSYDMVDTREQNSPIDPVFLYTLAYLESHTIEATQDAFNSDKLSYFCNVSVLIPNNRLLGLNEANQRLVERSVNLRMGFYSSAQSNLHGRGGAVGKHQHEHAPQSDHKFNEKKLNKKVSVSFTNESLFSDGRRVRRTAAKSSSFIQVEQLSN